MYTAMVLGATGNVGRRILHLLVQSPRCQRVLVVTRRHVAELANPKVQQVVVHMDRLEEELAPHAKGVDIALAAFGVGKGSAKMADEEVRKIEVTYPTAFASAAKAGGARVLAMMTSVEAIAHNRMTKRGLLCWWRIQLCQQERKMSEASSSDGPNAAKSEAARFLARFPAVFARLRTTFAGEMRVIPGR